MSNITTADYLNQLLTDKETMITNLQAKGVPLSGDETFTELAPAISEIPSVKQVVAEFYDYNGEVVYSYSKEEVLALTALPAGPLHPEEGLVFDGWNWTLEEIKNYVTLYPEGEVIVGSLFNTNTGATRLYVTLTNETLNPELRLSLKNNQGTVTIDWGDSSAPEVHTNTTVVVAPHTYSAPGNYVISFTSTIEIQYSSNSNCPPSFWGAKDNTGGNSNKAIRKNIMYWQCVTKLQFGSNTSFYAAMQFEYVPLKYITMPSTVTLASPNNSYSVMFAGTYSLAYVAFPRVFTKIGSSVFNSCCGVIVSLPGNLTNFTFAPGTGTGINYPIRKLTLPDSCVEFTGSNGYWGLKKLVIPRYATQYSPIKIPIDLEELYLYNVYHNTQTNTETWAISFSTSSRNKLRVLKYYGDTTKLCSVSGNFAGIDFDSLDTNIDLTRITAIGSSYTFAYAKKEVFDLRNLTSGYQFSYTFTDAVTRKVLFGEQVSLSSGGSSNTNMFARCYVLTEIKLPKGITGMASMISYAPIDTLVIPSTVTNLGSSPFSQCSALRIIDLRTHTAVPSISTNYSSSSLPSLEYVVVPDDLYESWTTVGTWASYADFIIKASDYEAL